jgi:hypothetical protein
VNSPLLWWHNWRFPHTKDEALSPVAFLMERPGTEQQFGAILEHLASASYQGLDRDDSFESAA